MAHFYAFLFPWRKSLLADQLGDEAAGQCRSELWRSIGQRTQSMGAPEIRGYARAQGADILAVEADRVLDRHHAGRALKSRVFAAGMKRLIEMAVRDAFGEPSPAADSEKIAA